ncbi:MAG: hypothetical protein HYZ26_08405 [Chloroflexi bacterium]|nr:hypothetical protein [Chloroflexota bacterium]
MARNDSRPLWIALAAILALSVLYLWVTVVIGSIPAASEFFGHSLGVIGFLLMVSTETLYSIRKRSPRFNVGRLSIWLEFHIVTGLVGPFMVLLHSAWKFNGLAGVVLLLTVLIVLSGFVGRYIYTALPRTADGLVLEAETLKALMTDAQARLDAVLGQVDERTRRSVQVLLGRPRARLGWLLARRAAPGAARPLLRQVQDAALRLTALRRQHRLLAAARRALALWHAVHVPIGLALFTTASVHIVAAFYYATMLR